MITLRREATSWAGRLKTPQTQPEKLFSFSRWQNLSPEADSVFNQVEKMMPHSVKADGTPTQRQTIQSPAASVG